MCLLQEISLRVCYPTQEVERVGKRSSESTREVSSRFQQLCEVSTVACIYMLGKSTEFTVHHAWLQLTCYQTLEYILLS